MKEGLYMIADAKKQVADMKIKLGEYETQLHIGQQLQTKCLKDSQ
jgi:hypothetical protein